MAFIAKLLIAHRPFLIVITLLIALRVLVLDWHPIPSESMKPTILDGDLMLVNKLAYGLHIPGMEAPLLRWSTPKRGDIVVYYSEKAGKSLVKRVVALPNDMIILINNQLLINGVLASYYQGVGTELLPKYKKDHDQRVYLIEKFKETIAYRIQIDAYRGHSWQTIGHKIVPKGHYYLLGDNRDSSADSRVYGVVSQDSIIAKARYIVGSLIIKDQYQPRWNRFGLDLYDLPEKSQR